MFENNYTPSSVALDLSSTLNFKFEFTFGHQCPEGQLTVDPFSEDIFKIQRDGTLHLVVNDQTTLAMSALEYCIYYIDSYNFISTIVCIKAEEICLFKNYGKI